MNRGIARRSVFETRADARYFLSRVAREVRAGRIEVLAYALMTNHFHLLVRSPRGELGRAIGRVENAYVRWFNRRRRRDGPLFRGRFRSRPLGDREHLFVLLRYIDHNPVEARSCARPEQHPWGSARHYARPSGPRWLARAEVELDVARAARRDAYRPEDYARLLGLPPTAEQRSLVEVRLEARGDREDELARLRAAAPERVARWLAERARAADGRAVLVPMVSPRTLQTSLAEARAGDPAWQVVLHGRRRDGWPIVGAGLLRIACAQTLREVARRGGISERTASRAIEEHRRLCRDERGEYAARAGRVLRDALDREHPRAGEPRRGAPAGG